MPSDKHNLITAKAMGLIFHCSMSLRPDRCLLAYCSTYNAFFMDLPMSSFVSHLSLLTGKGVDLAVACDGFPLKWKSSTFFVVAVLIAEVVLDLYCCETG